MRDGEEKKVEAELVFVYTEEDHSVGINGGFALAGIQVGDTYIILDEHYERTPGRASRTYIVDPADAPKLDRLAEGLSESAQDIEPDLSEPDDHGDD
jgi:hypothetical protein